MRLLVIAASSGGFLPFLKPVGDVLMAPFVFMLAVLYGAMHGVGPLNAVGAYGLAIIGVTVVIKLILFPLFQKQLTMSKKTQAEQRRIQPELAELRKKFKGRTTTPEFNQAMMALYKEHGINPLGGLAGCLPTLVQMPIIIGLYQSIYHFKGNIQENFLGMSFSGHIDSHFLWIQDLTKGAHTNDPITWILPALAGVTTYVQTKMMAPPPANPDEQDSQAQMTAQMSSTMSLMMPAMILFFSFQPQVFQGVVLYWIVQNLFAIMQAYFVNGWGQLPILGGQSAALAGATVAPTNGKAAKRGGADVAGGADITAATANNGNGRPKPRRQTSGGKRRRR